MWSAEWNLGFRENVWARDDLAENCMWCGWMSPRFGSVGCLGAIIFWLIMVAAILGLLYIPWSLVRGW
jgi:hypothetical protein